MNGERNSFKRLRVAATLGVAAALACVATSPCHAQAGRALPGAHVDPISFRGPNPSEQFKDIYIDQKLNNQVPLELSFNDENGASHPLREYMTGKPVVLAMVYYQCPNVCSVIINSVLVACDAAAMGLQVGKDFDVLVVSIDPKENAALAAEKKGNYAKRFHREGFETGFRFLTGAEDNIDTLANAVGFRYFYDKETGQYAHASGIMVLTPEGKVSSYYLGNEFMPKKLQFALMDAAKGNIGPLVDKLVLLCFQYDPSVGAYGFYIMNAVRLFALAVILVMVGFWILMWLRERAKPPVEPLPVDPTAPTQA